MRVENAISERPQTFTVLWYFQCYIEAFPSVKLYLVKTLKEPKNMHGLPRNLIIPKAQLKEAKCLVKMVYFHKFSSLDKVGDLV